MNHSIRPTRPRRARLNTRLGAGLAAAAVAAGSALAPSAALASPSPLASPAAPVSSSAAADIVAEPEASPTETMYERARIDDGAPAPQPKASAWVVGDLDSGEVFTSQEMDRQLAPASVIKLLTALALVDVLDDPEQKYEAVFDDMAVDGTKVGLVQKNEYTIDQLFHAMLMSSANDAAHALGNAAGGQDRAVELMEAKAEELGLTGTVPKNTSGLDADGQVTTVHDQLIIARAMLDNDYLMKIVQTTEYRMPGGVNPETKEKFKGYPIQDHTKIVGRVDGGLGLKNGYTVKSKGSFVAVAERDGKTYAAAILHSDNSTRQAAIDLLDWSFAQSDLPVETTIALTPEPSEEPSPEPAAPTHEKTAAAEAQEPASPLSSPLILIAAAAAVLAAGGIAFTALRRRDERRRAAATSE
ncbi:D-alanyl-D-alanine carboxypeptidase family protein [Brevibacterium gallinarum]|nr:serine hydrolase [Brevibacterium gallinarum]